MAAVNPAQIHIDPVLCTVLMKKLHQWTFCRMERGLTELSAETKTNAISRINHLWSPAVELKIVLWWRHIHLPPQAQLTWMLHWQRAPCIGMQKKQELTKRQRSSKASSSHPTRSYVHFDTKLVSSKGRDAEDRGAVLISGGDELRKPKLLGISQFPGSKGVDNGHGQCCT